MLTNFYNFLFKEFMEMLAKAGDLSNTDLTQKKAELKLNHKKQLAAFDKETERVLEEADKDPLPSLEVAHAHQRLELRERQLNELAGSMKDLLTKDDLVKQYQEQAEKATQAADEFRQKTLFDMAQKIEEIKKARAQKSEEQRRAMEEEIKKAREQKSEEQRRAMEDEVKRLEAQLEREREEEALREAEKEAEMEADRKRKKQEKEEADRVNYGTDSDKNSFVFSNI